jgi:acyl-CoA thioester hydrolase
MRRLTVDYLSPAIAGDLDITTWIQELRGSRAIGCYEIRKKDRLLVVKAEVWVWVESASMRPKAIPQNIARLFTK